MKAIVLSVAQFAVLATLLVMPARSSASAYTMIPGGNGPEPAMTCIVYEERIPEWTDWVYFATYPHHAVSKEGWEASYYGGLIPSRDAAKNRCLDSLYSAWQMVGKDHPTTGIAFVHVAPWMGWHYSNWEGSAGGMSGHAPSDAATINQWWRFVHRVWTPASKQPHTGYTGVWMRNMKTGRWYHLSTIKYPAELIGFANLQGFIERFGGPNSTENTAVELRNCYALRHGVWKSEADFVSRAGGSETTVLTPGENGDGLRLIDTRNPMDPETKKVGQTPATTHKITMRQPETPGFLAETTRASSPASEWMGDQLVARWSIADTATPQLGYEVKVFDGDTCIATASANDPEARQCTVTLSRKPAGPLQVAMALRDIFDQTTPEIRFDAAAAKPHNALAPAEGRAATPGLRYRYYQTDTPKDWVTLPNFDILTAKHSGVVATPDLTPRLARKGYGFVYEGILRVPADGLYTFNLVAASGACLKVDGQTIIDADGDRAIAKYPGTVALKAGAHAVRVSYYHGAAPREHQADDFLQLLWAGPGFAMTAVPASAFVHKTEGPLPVLTMQARQADEATIALSSHLEGTKATRIAYYAVNDHFPYFTEQGADRLDYLLCETDRLEETVTAPIWGGSQKVVRARAFLTDGRTVDSAPITLNTNPSADTTDVNGMKLTALEYHLYPAAHTVKDGTITVVADSMSLVTKPHKGDVTIVARLADIIKDQPMSDGTKLNDANNWFSGIILRNNNKANPGEPLGGTKIPFIAIMANASGQILRCDSTMINGAGNQPTSIGKAGASPWFKLTRKGQTLSSFYSQEGKTWELVASFTLPTTAGKAVTYKVPAMNDEIEIGFVQYSLPSATPRIQWSKFDQLVIMKGVE